MLLLLLCLFAFLAGYVDAMVGGGGLIQLPALLILQPQLALAQILATNKTASFCGTTVAAVRYIRKVRIDWKHLSLSIIAAFIGGLCGAVFVSFIHKDQFMPIIIIALVVVLFYTLYKRELGLHQKEKLVSRKRYYWYAIGTGAVLGFYEGLIGPGTGSFLIFAFVILFGYNFLHASANAKVVNWVASLGALCFFLVKSYVVWQLALPIALANMMGNYAGSRTALKKGSTFIRIVFIVVVVALIMKLGFDYLSLLF
ncbi:MAG TPA: TSUP family transporter [Flavipsychrobacter sp.]|nr:TSUP family transporter [Flavipsychrobacter sp.]